MAFEIGECDPGEYEKDVPRRVNRDKLVPERHYTWMMALMGSQFKAPTYIEDVNYYDEASGLYLVSCTLVNEDNETIGPTRNNLFHDGYYMRESPADRESLGEFALCFEHAGEEVTRRVLTGYFRDDYGGTGSPGPGERTTAGETGEVVNLADFAGTHQQAA